LSRKLPLVSPGQEAFKTESFMAAAAISGKPMKSVGLGIVGEKGGRRRIFIPKGTESPSARYVPGAANAEALSAVAAMRVTTILSINALRFAVKQGRAPATLCRFPLAGCKGAV
jgi:hypothetical protein